MPTQSPTQQTLLAENADLRARLEEAEEMLRAIRNGEVDALVVDSSAGPQVFTLQGLDAELNRFRGEILEQVSDAVIVLDDDQYITYLNAAATQQYGVTAFPSAWLPHNEDLSMQLVPSRRRSSDAGRPRRDRQLARGKNPHQRQRRDHPR